MNRRREFIKLAPAVGALGITSAVLSAGKETRREEGNSILGAWTSIHTLPFPPGTFREILSFADGGVIHETNSFLHTASNLNFSPFGLPSAVNGSDGVGNWWPVRPNKLAVRFRKLLFDGNGLNFGDLLVTGTVMVDDGKLAADWLIKVVDVSTGAVLTDFGPAASEGVRLS